VNGISVAHEIGGEYHLCDFPADGWDPWPAERSFFASGRAALCALYRQWTERHPGARLWLPDYLCADLVRSLMLRGIPLRFYLDDPQRIGPDLGHLEAAAGDLVLAVNYFGVRSGDEWRAWRESTPEVGLVEDHTHDPQSLWARSSIADFAFASLRKTIPIPDGGIAWSPRLWPLPEAAPSGPDLGSSLKLAAMLYKNRYLDSGETLPSLKEAFLRLQKQGEQLLLESNGEAISLWSQGVVCCGAPSLWRSQRERNVRFLLELAPSVAGGEPLFLDWPWGHCPFNAIYLFEDETVRDRVRRRLIASQVYTPVHWPLGNASDAALDLSKRILTIPLDFRCDDHQIERIATVLMS
jgi:hypothetical protein